MTPAALASPWVQREVNAALNEHTAGRMLGGLPLVMQPCQEQDIPLLWRTFHRYDATRDYSGAVSGLLRALGLVASVRQPVPPAPTASAEQPASPLPTTSAQPSMPSDRFPQRLASLGFQAKVSNGVEVILPPICDVPAGEFLMGSDPKQDKEAEDNEKPQHWVTLPAFQIARFPVTVAEYACFVRAGGKEPQRWTRDIGHVTWQEQHQARFDHPVVCVSWQDAMAYAAWLAKLTDEPWRLPTEAEWE